MRTRAAAKRLAEMASAADKGVDSPSGPTESAPAQDITDNPASDTLGPSRMAMTGGKKRKRPSKKQAQPIKGGWVLPHGMGSGVNDTPPASEGTPPAAEDMVPAPETVPPAPEDMAPITISENAPPASEDVPHPSEDATLTSEHIALRSSPTSSPPGPLMDVETPAQDNLVLVSRPTNTETAPVPKKQTRLLLRVSKANAHAQTKTQEQQVNEPVVKLKGTNAERPRKRLRGVPGPAGNTSDATVSRTTTTSSAAVKTEDNDNLDKPARKVLVIKGIAIKDNIVTKVSDKIILDASQILNPEHRLMIKRGKENPYGLTPGFSPYPYRRVPTPDACEEVHRILTELHGEVTQPEKMPPASLEIAGCGEVPCVLDALLRTLISGNTTMALADTAIKNLAQHYGLRQEGSGAGSINWDKVRLSSHQELIQVIKVAGNGPKRSVHIKQILDMVHDEGLEQAKVDSSATAAEAGAEADEAGKSTQKPLSLDHMHGMSKDEAMAKFVSYPGIGIKTAACVSLFCLRMPCFAVDTHVHKFCRWLGWIPEKADPDNCFRHGDFMVPDHLKYGLHQLFIRHGQLCFKCRKVTKPGTKDWKEAPDCPLEHLLDRSKDEAGSKSKPKRKQAKEVKEEEGSGTDDDSEVDSKKKNAVESDEEDEADPAEDQHAAAAEKEE